MSLQIKGARWPIVVGGVVLAVIVVVGLCEAAGWPFLVGPMQRTLSSTLHRQVVFGKAADAPGGVRIGLLGSVRVTADRIEIGSPDWSKAPHMLLAEKARLVLGYGDLLRAYRGGALRIRELRAEQLDAQIERLEDGRATWQFGPPKPDTTESKQVKLPSFGELRVADGALVFRDAVLGADLDARFSLTERGTGPTPAADTAAAAAARASPLSASGAVARREAASASGAASGSSVAAAPRSSGRGGLEFAATGTYRKLPLKIELLTSSLTSLASPDGAELTQAVSLDAVIGRATVTFRGTATDPMHFGGVRGGFSVAGPSLAAVGDPLGITLPTTGPFKTDGLLAKDGDVWKAVFNQATIGQSRLTGSFTFDRGRKVPLLAGRLSGPRLLLKDLGPAVGGNPTPSAAVSPAKAASAAAPKGKVLPDRRFDLPSLRAMDANVLIDIAHLDLGSDLLEPLEPLRTHLLLSNGVLSLNNLEARTGQGSLGGNLSLDGRTSQAVWNADLSLLGVRLDRWLKQKRSNGAPPFISGQLDGQVKVVGKGRSTAEILGSLDGGMRFHLRNGSLSHLAVEVAGIDIGQALGMLVKGDEALRIDCNVADLVVSKGIAKPRMFVLDTRDSTVWIDGSLSLATEALDLRAIVSPKDFSPFALRTPIHVKGTFGDPSVSLEMSKLGGKVGAAALLSLLTPLAAVIPFIDTGAHDDAKREAAQCAALSARGSASRVPSGTAARPRK